MRDHTVSAVMDMPGVLAISLKGGACWFGEAASEEKVPSSGGLRLALVLCCLGVLLLGIIPGLVMGVAEFAAKMFAF